MVNAIEKARVLTEALPYIKKFTGATFVIKYGGSAMAEEKFKNFFMEDVALLNYVGVRTVLVHGGGDEISAMAKKLGKEAVFVQGHRVTDKEMLDIASMVLIGKVNKDIVRSLNLHNLNAIGLSGKDGNLLIAKKKKEGKVDIGFVGEVTKVNTGLLDTLEEKGYLPVIAPIGTDAQGNGYNINADLAAAEVAKALKADKLIYITDTDGVKINGKYVATLRAGDIAKNIKNKQITGGMIPKLNSAKETVAAGVKKVHIINGTKEHSMLLEIFTKEGTGTEIVK
ncbi:MAG: acetylglutamate kinase [Candidatus Goldiibacteriota bacterium HGW-Goldbacteria-1]|nr:MAG: acetylglutamate kinase [Candidatus Goldiibacteriota bacterium HGW-Goldbacteria-1]